MNPTLKTIEDRQKEIKKEFDEVKKKGGMFEKMMLQAQEKYAECGDQLKSLQAQWKELENIKKLLKSKPIIKNSKK